MSTNRKALVSTFSHLETRQGLNELHRNTEGMNTLHLETHDTMLDQLLDEAAIASKLKISRSLVRKWRRNKEGPPFFKLGKSVRYAAEDLAEWLQKHKAA
jgi:predicted DNA-binding transcriptional regulator AlpA